MKPYRNAAIILGALLALVIGGAGNDFTAEYILFLVTAAIGVLVVSALVLKALRDERA